MAKARPADAAKNRAMLAQVFSSLKKESGIDYYKVLAGDAKETQRLKLKHCQASLRDE